MKRANILIFMPSILLVTAIHACDDGEPLGVAGKPVLLDLSDQGLELTVGDERTVTAQLLDQNGDVVSFSLIATPCDPAVVHVSQTNKAVDKRQSFLLRAVGLGSTCVVVEGGKIQDTLTVAVGPATILIHGPGIVESGRIQIYDVVSLDRDSVRLENPIVPKLFSLDSTRLFVMDSGRVISGSPGAGVLQAQVPGGAIAAKPISVVMRQYEGATTANTGEPGDLIGLSLQSPLVWFDHDTRIVVDSTATFWEPVDSTFIRMAVPALASTGLFRVTLSDMGPYQVSQDTVLTIQGTPFQDKYRPASDGPATAPDLPSLLSPDNNLYLAHGGLGTGTSSQGIQSGGTQIDHWFAVTAGSSDISLDLVLEWKDHSDVDLLVCNASGIAGVCAARGTSGIPDIEEVTGTVPAGTTMYVIITMYHANTNVTNMRLHVIGL